MSRRTTSPSRRTPPPPQQPPPRRPLPPIPRGAVPAAPRVSPPRHLYRNNGNNGDRTPRPTVRPPLPNTSLPLSGPQQPPHNYPQPLLPPLRARTYPLSRREVLDAEYSWDEDMFDTLGAGAPDLARGLGLGLGIGVGLHPESNVITASSVSTYPPSAQGEAGTTPRPHAPHVPRIPLAPRRELPPRGGIPHFGPPPQYTRHAYPPTGGTAMVRSESLPVLTYAELELAGGSLPWARSWARTAAPTPAPTPTPTPSPSPVAGGAHTGPAASHLEVPVVPHPLQDNSPTILSPVMLSPLDLYVPVPDTHVDAPPPYSRVAGTPSPERSPARSEHAGSLFMRRGRSVPLLSGLAVSGPGDNDRENSPTTPTMATYHRRPRAPTGSPSSPSSPTTPTISTVRRQGSSSSQCDLGATPRSRSRVSTALEADLYDDPYDGRWHFDPHCPLYDPTRTHSHSHIREVDMGPYDARRDLGVISTQMDFLSLYSATSPADSPQERGPHHYQII